MPLLVTATAVTSSSSRPPTRCTQAKLPVALLHLVTKPSLPPRLVRVVLPNVTAPINCPATYTLPLVSAAVADTATIPLPGTAVAIAVAVCHTGAWAWANNEAAKNRNAVDLYRQVANSSRNCFMNEEKDKRNTKKCLAKLTR